MAPHTITLDEQADTDAYIVDANLERRDLTKGQKAMLVAVRFPDVKTHKGKRSDAAKDLVSKSISSARVSQARAVGTYCAEMVPLVIDGSMSLDAAYNEAQQLSSHPVTIAELRARCRAR